MAKQDQEKEIQTTEASPLLKGEAKVKVEGRSKTGFNYRRLGKVWRKDWSEDELTLEDLKLLKKDPWLEIREKR